MKRGIFRTSVAVFAVLMLTGCGELPNISEQQADLVAEYAGGVLLRYSSKYALRLVKNDVDGDGVEDSVNGVASGAAVTAAPDDQSDVSPSPSPSSSPEASSSPDPNASASPEESEEPAATPEPTEEPKVGLDELYNIKDLKFSYSSAMYTDRYPKNSSAYEITSQGGQILYVVTFKVKNTGSKTVKVNLTSRPFHYELSVGGDTYLPTLSLLPNGGLNYLMTKIKPGKTEKASLIFNIDRDKKGTKGNTLSITEGEKTAVVDL